MPANRIKREPALERRAKRQAERASKRKQMSCRILIVCEGEKTEPNYFDSFKTIAHGSFVYDVEAKGFGLNTHGVVTKAIELRSKAQIQYDAVWAVFDRDSFPANDFDNAIAVAEANDIGVAWSNEAFELWYLLHFQYRNTKMSRDDYKKAISDAVNASGRWSGKVSYVYQKNDLHNYNIMSNCGSQEDAIRNAEALCELFTDAAYHKHNPCTTVHKLVLQLLNKDEKLIAEVMDKINSML
ncbi:MAG: RloB family protein [Rikenellaceae bacterium]